MAYITMESRCLLFCLALTCLCVAITSGQSTDNNSRRRGNGNQTRRQRCTNCTVNGKEYRGHSRFQYEEDCFRYRCTCNCDGSYKCPARYTQNICDGEGNRRPDTTRHNNRRQQCQACVVNGKEYPGHAYFRYVDDCTTIDNCICYCNGTYKCPEGRARNSCEGGETNNTVTNGGASRPSDSRRQSTASNRRNNRCRGCVAKGKVIRGNSYFDLEDGCTAFSSCVCYCNGTWSCPASRARNICDAGAVPTTDTSPNHAECRSCQLNGRSFDGKSTFEYREGCKAYTNCNCHCNGSWTCPASGVVDMCSTDGRGQNGGCLDCSIMGNVYPGNRSFEIRDGCIEYSDCSCFCNGSWHCPENSARDVCKNDARESDRQTQGCRQCNAKGQIFDGNNYFDLTDGCIEYKDCVCHCNGSWSCPGDRASYICGSDRELDVGGSRKSCRECEVYGETFPANRNFSIKRGCIEYRDCRCQCNGSWDCPGSSARDVCKADRDRQPANRCSVCNAHNMEVEGNSYFELSDGCWEYKNCICHCNGTWSCPSASARNICDGSETENKEEGECVTCLAKGRSFAGNSRFELVDGCNHYMACVCNCDGSWSCPEEHTRNTCETEPIQDNCRTCEAKDGSIHQPNQPFKFMDGCIERECDCFCNGSWACPASRSRWACTDKCRQCDVNGRKVANGTEFQHSTGCLEYTCTCYCNGSWSCPGETVKNTCPAGVRNNCNTCRISSTEEHPGESDFVLKQGCLHYKCRCNCDGSYNCPAKDSRNVCHGEVLGGCRSCVVSDSEIYRGETDFRLRQDCIDYQCRCSCDGTWKCPGEKARNICLGEVPGGCKVCQVAEGEVYKANTVFDLRKECLHYKCKCNCDGSWSCPGEDTRNVCRGEVPGGCLSCVVSENEYYRGNSDFEMTKDCIHYQCRCNCDGSYNCPAETAKRVCSTDGSPTSSRRCQRCRITGGQEFQGNTNFTLNTGCTRRSCICRCDGSWECPAESNVCRNNSIPQQPQQQVEAEQRQPCRKCRRNGKEYPGNSDVKINRGCYEYDCTCNCNGRMSCGRPRNVCNNNNNNRGNRQSNGDSQRGRRVRPERVEVETCKSCDVAGQTVNARDTFYVDIGCKRYSECECRCSGDWTCGTKEDVCDGAASGRQRDTTPVVVKTGSSSKQLTVDTDQQVSQGRKTGDDNRRGSNFVTPDYNSSRRRQNYISQSRTTFTTSGSTPRGNQYVQRETGNSDVSTGRSGQCQQCLVDDKSYQTGAKFEMRRECVIYKCVCLCTGSYRCRPYSDSTCKKEETENTCSNCVHHGLVYPGGRGFTVREGCTERECNCLCNGTYTCPTSRDLPGCRSPGFYTQRDGANAVNVNYYRINGQPIRSGIPVLDTANQRRYVTGNTYSSNSRDITCLGCLVDGELRQGGSAFTFEKDCTEFICYCACGGSWKCEGRPSLSCSPPGPGIPKITSNTQTRIADSGSRQGSEVGRVDAYGCRSCVVQGTEYPSRARFSLRQGCYQYRCTCNCDGSWDCPKQSVAYLCSDKDGKDRGQGKYQRWSRGRPQTAASVAQTYVTDEEGNISVEKPAELVSTQENSNSSKRSRTSSGGKGKNVGCRPCTVDGQRVHALATFIRQLNCLETICRCQCHGVHSCPASASVNICELSDNKPISERKGCKVGRRTHFTRAFAKVENCRQRTCVCHDDGTWECRRTADDIKVC